jgi:thiol-disulfide isomerase/thioredoxin
MGRAGEHAAVRSRFAWLGIAVLAFAVGATLWWLGRPEPRVGPATISGAALYAVSFRDLDGGAQPLGQFQGRTLVLNFWATWCAPCREEMPAFDRLARQWSGRGVTFVGVTQEASDLVRRFQREVPVSYPLWTGGDDVPELAARLGNSIQALPFTAVVNADGKVVAAKVGPYSESELGEILTRIAVKS